MAKRKRKNAEKGRVMGGARRDTKLGGEYGTETFINPGTRRIEIRTESEQRR